MTHRPLPTVSVIIPTYNRRQNLPAVVSPLLADEATTEVIIVVDGCHDGSIELLEEMARGEPRLKPLFVENGGTARAQQIGVDAAVGSVVLLIADDVIAASGLVTGHARHHAVRDGIVVVGYMPIASAAQPDPGHSATMLYARAYERCCLRYEDDPSEILKALWGGNISVRRADCIRVPLHTDAFAEPYHEDKEWGIRCMRAGLVGLFDRYLRAEHRHRRLIDGTLRDARNEGRGRARVHQLHPDVLGPLDLGAFEDNLPRPAKWLVRSSKRPVLRAPLVAALRLLAQTAIRVRLVQVELRLVQLLRRIEIQRGAFDVVGADLNSAYDVTP